MSNVAKIPRTSAEWWETIKPNKGAFEKWLLQQFAGETQAAIRIKELKDKFAASGSVADFLLDRIITDEMKHARWIQDILNHYIPGFNNQLCKESGRYWNEVEPAVSEMNSLQYACAVATHAETMRLERITVIAKDDDFGLRHPYIQKVFKQILSDEMFHAEAFAVIAGPEAIKQAEANHHRGMEALGLTV